MATMDHFLRASFLWAGAALAAGGTWSENPRPAGALAEAGFDVETVSLLIVSEAGAPEAIAFADAGQPLAVGSLVKPFLALAYGEATGGEFPTVDCPGGSRCWLPAGHGPLDLRGALRDSCNRYFDELARRAPPERVAAVAVRYGLPAPPPGASAEALWGLGDDWRISPTATAAAYRELARRRADPVVATVLQGLVEAARTGTAGGVGRRLPARTFAKTGTAPCAHGQGGGDGFAAVVYPADNPRYTILLRIHGRTGRVAAEAAATVLSALSGL